MMDSFNNELQVGDRVLCLDAGIYTSHRINQIGSIAQILQGRMIVNFDLADSRDWGYPELNVPSGHGNCLINNQDIFVKIETHTEVKYREGDKVLCYCALDNDYTFTGVVLEEIGNGVYDVVDESGNNHAMYKSEILFLLERTQFKVGDEVVLKERYYNVNLFEEGYNQSIPTRIHEIDSQREDGFNSFRSVNVTIEMDNPSIGWRWRDNPDNSYWTLPNAENLFPKEFSSSLTFVLFYKYNLFSDRFEETEGVEEMLEEENEVRSNEPTSNLIHNYNYTPDETRLCRSEGEEHDESSSLYLGIELEISGSSQDSDDEEDAKEIMKVIQKDVEGSEKSVYFKHDGSINGFEIVFHPHTVKAYNEYDWKEIFSTIKKLGYTNDDKKAGFHVHISRKYFGDTTEQNEALAKMVFLMYKFKEEIEPLAGRKDSEYATYSAKALKRVKENDFIGTFRWYCDSCGKYSAINSQHKNTFELRIFDGVTDKVRFRDILNFVENLCNIVKCTSITDITKVRLEDFMPFLYSIEG